MTKPLWEQSDSANISFTTSTIVMVPPEGFRYNEQTAISNTFQHDPGKANVAARAMQEFENAVAELRKNDVNVLLLHQNKNLPDAVFPNNWFSTDIAENGKTNIYIYPMLTVNRRAEVNIEGLRQLFESNNIHINEICDLRENTDCILEGTGSMVFDKRHKLIYAELSKRTDEVLLQKLTHQLGYEGVVFHASDANDIPIYHTNVIMGLADEFAVICLESIRNHAERKRVEDALEKSGKSVIAISLAQMGEMCGNVLALHNRKGEKLLLMSSRAKQHFMPVQLAEMQKYCKIVAINIETIEQVGGGSARCMAAEIFYRE